MSTPDVSASLDSWSTTQTSNAPLDATNISTNLAANLRQIQATTRTVMSSNSIASASTTDLSTIPDTTITVTGTTAITALGTLTAGMRKKLVFAGALTLTHNATSLILPGAANITTVAGDTAEFVSLGAGNWRCLWYQQTNGRVIVASGKTITHNASTTFGGTDGKTVAFNASLTFAGTDGTTVTFPGSSTSLWQSGYNHTASGPTAARTFTFPDANATLARSDAAQSFSGLQTFAASGIALLGSSTGYTTFASANAGATNYTITFPAANDTAATIAATQTLTNKTLLSSGPNTVEATSAPGATPFALRNKAINGNFDIWQRGTSFASTGYTADRWYCGALSNVTLARGSISDGSATYCLNFTATNATNSSNVYQPIESYTVNTLKGKQVTLSFNITASTGTQTVSYRVRKNATGDTATGGTWSDIGNGTIGATTATQTKSLTVTIPNDGTANGVSVQFDFSNITNGAVISIWAVQLEVGAVATPFETRPYGMELSLCQRYYYRKNAAGVGVPFCQGFANSTTLMYGWLDFPVPMRVAPAAIEQDGTASDYRIGYAVGATACSAVPAYVAATTFGAMTSFTVASGLTAGQAVLAENAANSPYLGWSAEL